MKSLILLLTGLLASCTSVTSSVLPGALRPPRSIQVFAREDASGDARVKAALEHELLQRGFRNGDLLTVEFEDTWHWDITMYLLALNVRFIDSGGRQIGMVCWRQKGLHVYPSQESAVQEIFQKLDEMQAFQK